MCTCLYRKQNFTHLVTRLSLVNWYILPIPSPLFNIDLMLCKSLIILTIFAEASISVSWSLIFHSWLIFFWSHLIDTPPDTSDSFSLSENFESPQAHFYLFHISSVTGKFLAKDKAESSTKLFCSRYGIIWLGVVISYIFYDLLWNEYISSFESQQEDFSTFLRFYLLKSSCFVISLILTSVLTSLA